MPHHSSNFAQVPTRENQAVPQLQFCIAQGASSKKSIEMFLKIGKGRTVVLRRTIINIEEPGIELDCYHWAIYCLRTRKGVLQRSVYSIAQTYFRAHNIQHLFNVTSKNHARLWVLRLLRISLIRKQEIDTTYEPRLVPEEGVHAEGKDRRKYVIKYVGLRGHPEHELYW
ncbi:hypothetical protein CPB85DRAFT_1254426 [Mucidula mucida]|nr:hypothetical protein CPB85DRAFT_1254426 [Mucidula mucida]